MSRSRLVERHFDEEDKIVPDYKKQVPWLREYKAGLDV